MREDTMQTWFPDDGDHLLSNGGDHLLDSSLDKMTNSPYDTYHDLEMFEHFSESTPSTAHIGHGKPVSEDADINDIDFKDVSMTSLTHPHANTITGNTTIPVNITIASTAVLSMEASSSSMIPRYSEDENMAFKQSPSAEATAGFTLGRSSSHTESQQLETPTSTQPDKKRSKRQTMQNDNDTIITAEFRPRSSIPARLSWQEHARQGILAAYSSRLNPYALHTNEYELLRAHITKPQVTVYLNIRNAILRLWHRNPMVAVTKQEAAGCAKDSRHFALALISYEWLLRNGYINFGCVDVPPQTIFPYSTGRGKFPRQKTVVVIGAGMSGLGCARQLDHLFKHFAGEFAARREYPPKIIVIEGRRRIGGRVFSHPLIKQGGLPNGLRSTAEMGAQIVVGFDHGNPLNCIIRGQLAIPYHAFRDVNSPLYDCDGRLVDKSKDMQAEKLWNDILERASVFRSKLPTVRTVAGDRSLIIMGEDGKENSDEGELLASLEDQGHEITISANTDLPENAAFGVEKLAGRQYQLTKSADLPAAQAAKEVGWLLKSEIPDSHDINLARLAQSTTNPSLGGTLDDGIRQYQDLVNLTAQDLRLLNWHHANLEYANAANLNDLSLAGWDQDIGNEFEGHHSEIIGGYTQVPRGLMLLPEPLDVLLGHTVDTIRYKDEASAGIKPCIDVKCSNGLSFEADRLVLTTPLGVLKHGDLKFQPPLPDWKTGAIDRMGFGLLNKVVLVYDKCFWEEDRDMFGLLNSPKVESTEQEDYNTCRGRFYLFWNCIKTSGRPVLIALMAGAAAFQAEETDNETLVKEATERLAKIFAPRKVPPPLEYIVTRWKRDPFARGTYSYVGTKTQQGDYDVMARPVGPIHFAGEATCGTHPATVHGAYISGLRAASEVIDSLLGPIQIDRSPLVPPKPKNPAAPTPTPKRKFGYVHVWEPINKPDPFYANLNLNNESEDYEARMMVVIVEAIGPRPVRPMKKKLNPYLLYTKDEWANCKAALDVQKVTATGNQQAKASKDEIRAKLGADWRNAPEVVKQPYMDKCKDGREQTSEVTAEYNRLAQEWESKSLEVRAAFIKENPPPASFHASRKSRKSIGS